MADLARLRAILNNSGLQTRDNALYQVVNELISRAISSAGVTPESSSDAFLKKGSIPFSDGDGLTEDNANLNWDDANDRLGIGINPPTYQLDIRGKGGIQTPVHISNSKVDGGGYFVTSDPANIFLCAGAMHDGVNWIAKASKASLLGLVAGTLNFYTNSGLTPGNTFSATNVFYIDDFGKVVLIFGQLVFPNAQNPSPIPTCLDDYEEGTWTPVLITASGGAAGYASQAGQYIKIGKMVQVDGLVAINSKGSLAAAQLGIGGFPFVSAGVTYSQLHISYFSGMLTAACYLGGMVYPSNNSAYLHWVPTPGQTGISGLVPAQINTNLIMYFSATYEASA